MSTLSPKAISIRLASPADVPLILSLIRELAEYERLAHEVTATEEQLAHWLFGPTRMAEALVAHLDAEPVGFALFFHNFSTFLAEPGIYLEDLFVRPAFRGRGVGAALLAHVAQIAVERRCGRFEWSVLDWNQPAIDFYKRFGATPMEDWTVFRVTGAALQRLAQGSAVSSQADLR